MKEIDKSMYYGASPFIFQAAYLLRQTMTQPEKMLWEHLKMKKVRGLRFRRQHPIDIFIADFYCHEAKLIIEVDGDIHKSKKEYDIGRDAEMEKYGLKVLRFHNTEVENNIDEVILKIESILKTRMLSPPWGI